MEALRLGKSVRRVTVLDRDASGAVTPMVVFEGRKKKKKQSRAVRPLEKVVRRWTDAQSTLADNYLSRHKKSNRKKRDGWMRDLSVNVARAGRKGTKRLKMNRWITF